MKNQFVVITTDKDKRGVFAGILIDRPTPDTVVLEEARMAVYWVEKTRGVLGLAAVGPQSGSRISYAVPRIELMGVTSISLCTEKAIKRWRREEWSQ